MTAVSAATVSALVVVHNEQEQLAQCLRTLDFADEIVVVLDKCTDDSKAIAQKFNAKLVEGSWDLEGPRRNAGIDACSSQWVFEIDADERATPELADEITAFVAKNPAYTYVKIPVDNYIGTTRVKHGWGGSFGKPKYPGLFKQNTKRWGDQRVHPALTWGKNGELKDNQGPDLTHPILHYVDQDITDMMKRLNGYADKRALDLVDSGDIGTLRTNMRRFFSRFIRCYWRRKGYKEGHYGVMIALGAALFPVVVIFEGQRNLEQ